jgi:DNA-binding transcriptional LysR family regulator
MDAELQYLYEAASCGSMRRASEKLGVAVSSVSRQIAQLEKELGVALIERNRRTIMLTDAGNCVLSYYRSRAAAKDLLLERLAALREARAGIIHLSVGEGFLSRSFVSLLRDFRQSHSNCHIEVFVEANKLAVQRVLDDEAHIGVVLQVPAEPGIRVRCSVAQPLLVICQPEHPIARKNAVTLRELSTHTLALLPKTARLRELIAIAEANSGVWLDAKIITSSIFALRELAKIGEAVTILPRVSVLAELEDRTLTCVPIAEPSLRDTEMSIITRLGRQLSAAPSQILQLLEAKLRSLG